LVLIRNIALILYEVYGIQKPFCHRKATKIFFESLEKGKKPICIQTSNTNTAAVKLKMT